MSTKKRKTRAEEQTASKKHKTFLTDSDYKDDFFVTAEDLATKSELARPVRVIARALKHHVDNSEKGLDKRRALLTEFVPLRLVHFKKEFAEDKKNMEKQIAMLQSMMDHLADSYAAKMSKFEDAVAREVALCGPEHTDRDVDEVKRVMTEITKI